MAWLPTEPVNYIRATKRNSAFRGTDSFWLVLCIAFIGFVSLLGGSPRPEVATVPVLQGAAVFLAVLGLGGLTRKKVRSAWLIMLLALGFLVALPLIHLVPLPPGFAAALPGREVLGQIDQAVGTQKLWRPLSLSPLGTANALLAACVPLATLVLGLNVSSAHHHHLAQWLVGLGLIGLCFALGQMMAPSGSAFYLYETVNRGSPVGLFANRNHHAVFLACLIVLVPIAFSIGRNSNERGLGSLDEAVRIALVLLIILWIVGMALLTGSRSGALATCLALLAVPLIISAQISESQANNIANRSPVRLLRRLALMVGLGTVIPFALWIERAPGIDRLLGSDPDTEERIKILPQVLELTWLYWPWGSGPGSFEKVYQLHEPEDLLIPEYFNHAHNDVIEVLMTTGASGLITLVIATIFWFVLVLKVFIVNRFDAFQSLRKAGLIIIFLLSVASTTDYPLRAPALAALFALAWIWAALPYRSTIGR